MCRLHASLGHPLHVGVKGSVGIIYTSNKKLHTMIGDLKVLERQLRMVNYVLDIWMSHHAKINIVKAALFYHKHFPTASFFSWSPKNKQLAFTKVVESKSSLYAYVIKLLVIRVQFTSFNIHQSFHYTYKTAIWLRELVEFSSKSDY